MGKVEWRIMTPEEEAARDAAIPPEIREAEERRAAFDEKHPRCDACGQFLKKWTRPPNMFDEILLEPATGWVSHYVQDYWGEWDHI